MKAAGIVGVVTAVAVVAAMTLIRVLSRRVVKVSPRRKSLRVRGIGDLIEMPARPRTIVPGNYGLWFGERFEQHALIGSVVVTERRRVIRQVLRTTAALPTQPFEARWTGHLVSGPAGIDPAWEDVEVPLRDGTSASAWLFPGTSSGATWVIHVQGIRTSRLVTLRSVEVAQRAGLTSLAITFRGAGDGPPASVSMLGQTEWSDLADAISFARSRGARAVYVIAWSMGAGLSLELLRREPGSFDRLVVIAPATSWREIIMQGVKRARLPAFIGRLVTWSLSSEIVSRCIGIPEPLDFRRLDWTHADLPSVPILAVHSTADEEVPFHLTRRFVMAHKQAVLEQTPPAPHGWEANVDLERFNVVLGAFLAP